MEIRMPGAEIEIDLWELLDSTDEESRGYAKDAIATHYQYLVAGTARKIQRKLPPYIKDDDLISYGQLGLLRSIGRYNPESGPFSRFASAAVYGAIIDGLRQEDFAPRGLRKKQRDMEAAVQTLKTLGKDVTDGSVAEVMGVAESDVLDIKIRIERADISPHDPTTMRASCDSQSPLTQTMCHEFVSLLQSYDITTQKVIAMKYWDSASMKTIGTTLGISIEDAQSRHRRVASDTLALAKRLFSDD